MVKAGESGTERNDLDAADKAVVNGNSLSEKPALASVLGNDQSEKADAVAVKLEDGHRSLGADEEQTWEEGTLKAKEDRQGGIVSGEMERPPNCEPNEQSDEDGKKTALAATQSDMEDKAQLYVQMLEAAEKDRQTEEKYESAVRRRAFFNRVKGKLALLWSRVPSCLSHTNTGIASG